MVLLHGVPGQRAEIRQFGQCHVDAQRRGLTPVIAHAREKIRVKFAGIDQVQIKQPGIQIGHHAARGDLRAVGERHGARNTAADQHALDSGAS